MLETIQTKGCQILVDFADNVLVPRTLLQVAGVVGVPSAADQGKLYPDQLHFVAGIWLKFWEP